VKFVLCGIGYWGEKVSDRSSFPKVRKRHFIIATVDRQLLLTGDYTHCPPEGRLVLPVVSQP
jgi:hypothetical protein